MSEWQTIETAPKDGTMILLYNRAHNEQAIMGWSVGFDDEVFPEGCWTNVGSKNQAITIVTNGLYYQDWMQLPEPPLASSKPE